MPGMESIDSLIMDLPAVLFRAGIAVLCGGIIGIERELRQKPAGFRTNILICLGAALYMMISERVAKSTGGEWISDPGRIAAQVVTGIGFLGAGTIIRARGNVIGLTSAAMIWLAAAIGLWIGAGNPLSGLILTILTILTFTLLGSWEQRLIGKCVLRECSVVVRGDADMVREKVEKALEMQRVPMEDLCMERVEGGVRFLFPVCSNHPAHRGFLANLWEIEEVQEVRTSQGTIK